LRSEVRAPEGRTSWARKSRSEP